MVVKKRQQCVAGAFEQNAIGYQWQPVAQAAGTHLIDDLGEIGIEQRLATNELGAIGAVDFAQNLQGLADFFSRGVPFAHHRGEMVALSAGQIAMIGDDDFKMRRRDDEAVF